MKNLFALLILSFVALPTRAQLVQSSVIPESVLITPSTVHVATLPKPVIPGDFLTVFQRNCNSSQDTTRQFTDSQTADLWLDMDIYHTKWYVESAAGGVTTLTYTSATPNYCQPLLAEFAGSWELDVISHPLYTDDVTVGVSYPITPAGPGELILGFGVSDCNCAQGYGPQITPGTGFQFAAFSNPALIEYQVDSTGAFVKATFNQSFSADAIVFVAAFKQKAGCKV